MEHFRETICGNINSEVKRATILAPVFDIIIIKDIADIEDVVSLN
ncbi:hypothetical protein [Clostridium sp. AWRP]|nr:hypothetical protein [Clostridium sp. AWRP]